MQCEAVGIINGFLRFKSILGINYFCCIQLTVAFAPVLRRKLDDGQMMKNFKMLNFTSLMSMMFLVGLLILSVCLSKNVKKIR